MDTVYGNLEPRLDKSRSADGAERTRASEKRPTLRQAFALRAWKTLASDGALDFLPFPHFGGHGLEYSGAELHQGLHMSVPTELKASTARDGLCIGVEVA